MKTILLTLAVVAVATAGPLVKRDVSHLFQGASQQYLPPHQTHQQQPINDYLPPQEHHHHHHHHEAPVVHQHVEPHVQHHVQHQAPAPVPHATYGVPQQASPVFHAPAPVVQQVAPVYHAPAPVVHQAPVQVPEVQYLPAPVVHHAPIVQQAPVQQQYASNGGYEYSAPAPVQQAAPQISYQPAPVQKVAPQISYQPAPVQQAAPQVSYQPAPVHHVAPQVFYQPAPVQQADPQPQFFQSADAPAQEEKLIFDTPVQSIEVSQSHTVETIPAPSAPVQEDVASVEAVGKTQSYASNGGYLY